MAPASAGALSLVNGMKNTRLNIYDEFPNSVIDAAIEEWIHDERHRRILHYKLVDGMTYERIADIEEMSPKGVQKIVYAAEHKLFKHLKQ
ncbi:MAG: hypothetical protein J6W84_01740 [Bacteroidales bacterium]|nr:hypothetical protein [Bacteroidales bacterium]